MEAGKRQLAGDTARSAATGEVSALRREAYELNELVPEQRLELRLLQESMIGDGGDGKCDIPLQRNLKSFPLLRNFIYQSSR